MPSVNVVPVYVEINSGFERALPTLESILRRAGYVFCMGDPLPETLDETRGRLGTDQVETDQWVGTTAGTAVGATDGRD